MIAVPSSAADSAYCERYSILLDIQEMHVAQGALRQGALYDLLDREQPETDLRTATVQGLVQSFAVDPSQRRACRWHRMQPFHSAFGNPSESVLRKLKWAGRLRHEIGCRISTATITATVPTSSKTQMPQALPSMNCTALDPWFWDTRARCAKQADLEDTTFALQLMSLRLAVALCHARREPDLDGFAVSIKGQRFHIAARPGASTYPSQPICCGKKHWHGNAHLGNWKCTCLDATAEYGFRHGAGGQALGENQETRQPKVSFHCVPSAGAVVATRQTLAYRTLLRVDVHQMGNGLPSTGWCPTTSTAPRERGHCTRSRTSCTVPSGNNSARSLYLRPRAMAVCSARRAGLDNTLSPSGVACPARQPYEPPASPAGCQGLARSFMCSVPTSASAWRHKIRSMVSIQLSRCGAAAGGTPYRAMSASCAPCPWVGFSEHT